ncbi:MAG TPA: MG2 domain-containing protein [Pyrinomonadaceae bacterium]|nr:MG2 domain-containing protein [Pyrinomonadaceae bacterium]
MRRRWLSLLLCLQVCLCAFAVATLVNAATQTLPLRVDETASRVSFGEGSCKISLVVENSAAADAAGRAAPAHFKLELLDRRDKVVARTQRREHLRPGANNVPAFLPFPDFARSGEDIRYLLWYRLRYEITPGDGVSEDAASRVAGIISLSEITPDLFELRVSAAEKANEGQLYRVRVRATHPLTSRPVRGVAVTAEVSLDEDDDDDVDEDAKKLPLKLAGTTNADGYVTLDFKLPARIKTDEGEIKVTGRRGEVVQTASDDIDFSGTTRILLTSDKPLYQPGQTLHLRALFLNHATRRALAEREATLEIDDPEGTTVFKTPLKTSRFGVASVDWPIPENTRLGDYSIKVSADDDDSDDGAAYQRVKISRYELPNFTVTAAPERPYYLPGESAEIEVRGDYLFGQPVKRGRVRLVRETERVWNYKEQRYDTKEGERYEGELGADGRFRVRLNLSKEHAGMASNSWQRFLDLNYAAYLTDSTTNRTEQRRFQVRLTREPIHIYVTQGNYRQAKGLPLVFYVSASYADGTPAVCELKLTPSDEEDDKNAKLPATVKTNAYGVAKVVGSELSGEMDEYFYVRLTARDREGREGRHTESLWLAPHPVLRVETDRVIYRAGEPLAARVSSNGKDARVFVDVVSNSRVVATETLRLRGGSALVEFPYRPEFQNRVTLAAYTTDFPDNSYDDYTRSTRTVIYPRNRELKFDVRLSRASYQPGEEAAAGVRVLNASGRGVESALGVVVFDKAVEERARTEQEFASSYGFSNYFYHFWYGSESIGGLSVRDVEQLDARRTLPAGLETVAELLLQRDDQHYYPNFFSSGNYETNQAYIFADHAATVFRATRAAFEARDKRGAVHPSDEASLRRVLAEEGIALEELRDPWGTLYVPVFHIEQANDVLEFKSVGADKRRHTDDDWTATRFTWNYFRPAGEAINRALADYHKRTGNFIRDAVTLKEELARARFDLAALERDRWGQPYGFTFEVNGTNYVLKVLSGGLDRRLTFDPYNPSPDDFAVWTALTDYFAGARTKIDSALAAYTALTGEFPRDEAALQNALSRARFDWKNLRDPWLRPYYANFHEEARYGDRTHVESNTSQQTARNQMPVTRRLQFVTLRSAGADGQTGTPDDFTVAAFSRLVSEQSARDGKPQAAPAQITFSGDTGAISGTVFDPTGAVVPGANVTATHQHRSERVFETTTDEEGKFLLRNLPAGPYIVRANAPGFNQTTVTDVLVYSATLATINFNLQVGTVQETVTVAAAEISELSVKGRNFSSLLALKPGATKAQDGAAHAPKPPVSTPRLRKDFPETLYWQPAVETDARGRAELRFKLADNITTWKMSIIGSTETGELGTVEREIRAFQPFFVEHDPPRVLTEGDEINLPVVLRNYLERVQTVALDIKPEEWFTLLGPARKETQVAAGEALRETFDFRAVASVKEGLQRITAIGGDASDQIERAVYVHPDGEELAETTTQILRESSLLEVNLPAETIPHSARAELKLYPNLTAHAVESVEAIMQRPYGCGEQTISSTYPSLLVLRHYRRMTAGNGVKTEAPIAAKAARYLRQGYERLLSYRTDGGGFAYWGRGEADLALTAYALRFLTDASEFTDVDQNVLAAARQWLVGRQNADGSWTTYASDKNTRGRADAMLTSYVARILAMQRAGISTQSQDQTQVAKALRRALDFLAPRTEEADEPYLIAAYALAAIDGGEPASVIARPIRRLRALAHDEESGSYWKLETNTPFYGWGQAGRIETTALVVQALTKAKGIVVEAKSEPARPEEQDTAAGRSENDKATVKSAPRPSDELIDRGLLFLLKNKDRYGVWLSTQATVNVLDALAVLSPAGVQQPAASAPQTVEVFVNGRSAGTISLPASHEPANPVALDLSRFVSTGANRVELKRSAAAHPAATAQLVTTYYRPWSASTADGRHARPQDARALSLDVRFDRTTAATGETVTCRVAAERIGHRGYGMLLAEVGLPPGADVDRASLERAMKESGWEFSHYDLLPDRLVVYLWPRAGGTNFQFTFRPRYGLSAKSAPSVVYDYYNPEARATVAPTKFSVADQPRRAPTQAGRD